MYAENINEIVSILGNRLESSNIDIQVQAARVITSPVD